MTSLELQDMQGLARQVWRRDPALIASDASYGALTWTWAVSVRKTADVWAHRRWHGDSGTVAWGWIFLSELIRVSVDRMEPSDPTLVWQVHPDHPDLVHEVLEWFEVEVGGARRRTAVRATDRASLERMGGHGYRHDPAAPWSLLTARPTGASVPPVPVGYRLTTMRQVGDLGRRVAVHRAAWEPSSVTEESYADVVATPPYREDFDFVVEAPDGSLAASALAWWDEENGIAEFEPVGTHPAHRRRGLGRALLLYALERLAAAGVVQAVVGCRGDEQYPAPRLLYESVGFREVTRDLAFVAGFESTGRDEASA